MISLNALVKQPDTKTFFFAVNEMTGELEEIAQAAGSDLALTLKYLSPREAKRLLADAYQRRPVSRRGIKAMVHDELQARAVLVKATLVGWTMSVRAAYALRFEGDLSSLKPSDTIPFEPENVQAMVERSALVEQVNEIVSDHSRWFKLTGEEGEEKGADDDDEGGEAGNLDGGPSSSTAS